MSTIDQAGDVDTFAQLKAEQDPRTIAEMIAEDGSYDVVVEKVDGADDGRWTVQWDGGTCTSLRGAEPKVGDTITFYGDEWGQRHGWALNGELVEWQTPWERFAERVRWLADYDRRKREEFAEKKPQLDADYEALPAALKARIDRFREQPDFRVDSEGYELFCCTEAAKLAQAARDAVASGTDADEVDRFWDTPEMRQAVGKWAEEEPELPEQRWLLWAWALHSAAYDYDHARQKAVTGLSDGHSGNTAGGSFSLAYAVLEGKEV